MLGRSHATIGAAVGVAVMHVLGADLDLVRGLGAPDAFVGVAALAGAPIAALAALLPDLDDPGSTLGALLPRWWHRLTPGHRGCTHSLLAVALVTLLVHTLAGAVGLGGLTLTVLVAAGMLSHLAADAVTDRGVPLLWPLRQHFGLPLMRTGGALERVSVAAVVVAVAWWELGVGALVTRWVA